MDNKIIKTKTRRFFILFITSLVLLLSIIEMMNADRNAYNDMGDVVTIDTISATHHGGQVYSYQLLITYISRGSDTTETAECAFMKNNGTYQSIQVLHEIDRVATKDEYRSYGDVREYRVRHSNDYMVYKHMEENGFVLLYAYNNPWIIKILMILVDIMILIMAAFLWVISSGERDRMPGEYDSE